MPKPTKVLTWRFLPANLSLPGMTNADLRKAVNQAGFIWSLKANVRFTEATGSQRPSFWIRTAYRPGAWGTWGPPYLNISTYGKNIQAWMAMDLPRRIQHFTSLILHEEGHALGCPQQDPLGQWACAMVKYGPPTAKAQGDVPDVQALPPAPRPTWRGWLRRLLQRRLETA